MTRLAKISLIILSLLIPSQVFATATTLDPGIRGISINSGDLGSAIGAGTEFALLLGNNGVPTVTWQTVYSAAPTAVTVNLEGSLDGTNWSTIDSSTSTANDLRVVTGTWKFVRANNSAVTDGTGKTLSVYITYARQIGNASVPLAIRSWTKTLTHAQILKLPSTPIVIAAADVGMVRIPWYMGCVLTAGTAYTNLGTTNFSLTNGADGRQMGAATSSTFFGATTANTFLWTGYGTSSVFLAVGPFVPSPTQNALYLEVSGSSDFTGGDASRSLTCTLWTVEFPYLFDKGRLQ